MNNASFEHIEAKIINVLHDAKAPRHASEIAVQIREKREHTLQAIQKLVKNGTIKGVQDFTLLHSTGEIMAYALINLVLGPAPTLPSVPPPPPSAPAHRRRAVGG
jgi:capsular polysaccharide biosynthesis protein